MIGVSLAQIQAPGVTRLLMSTVQTGPPVVPALPDDELPALPELEFPAVPAPVVPALPELELPAEPVGELPAAPESAGFGEAQPQASKHAATQEAKQVPTDARMGPPKGRVS